MGNTEALLCSRRVLETECCSSFRPYDYTKTTEVYGVPHFTGENSDIRPLLDYTWHRKYSAARVEVQDRIVAHMLRKCRMRQVQMLPWIVFTAGAMGAGKGYVMRWMSDQCHFPLDYFVLVDPDQIRQLLPEWQGYVRKDPVKAGELTQKEAGCIAEIVGYRALRRRANVIFDGSLRDADWYEAFFQKLRDEFPGVRIMILHVVSDKEEVLRRAQERGQKTGRMVPQEEILSSMEAVPKSVKRLAASADFVCRVTNRKGQPPTLAREEGAPNPPPSVVLSWDLFMKLWQNLDSDGDGELGYEEVEAALARGMITEAVVKSLDRNGDRRISLSELRAAQEAALTAGTGKWR